LLAIATENDRIAGTTSPKILLISTSHA